MRTDLLILIALLPPIIGQFRHVRPSAVAALAALGFLAAAAVSLIPILAFPERFTVRLGGNRAYHDTYYVVAHGHYLLGVAAFALCLWAGLRATEHFAGHRQSTMIRAFLWAFLLSVYGLLAIQYAFIRYGMPRRYADYSDAFAALNAASSLLALIGFASLLALATTLVTALFATWRNR